MTADLELFKSVIKDLKAWFPAAAHVQRDLPGGGKWFFIPWQTIRDRLDDVVPNWEVSYTPPQYLDKYCVVSCSITILGATRQAVGNAPIDLISGSGKNMERGNAIERAIADAFKNACEAWGVARYLDEQTDPKAKADFIKYMQSSGDGRAANLNLQNQGLIQPRKTPNPAAKPFGMATTKRTMAIAPKEPAIAPTTADNFQYTPTYISRDQTKQFWAIAKKNEWTEAMVSIFLTDMECTDEEGVVSSKFIQVGDYEGICNRLANEKDRDEYKAIAYPAEPLSESEDIQNYLRAIEA